MTRRIALLLATALTVATAAAQTPSTARMRAATQGLRTPELAQKILDPANSIGAEPCNPRPPDRKYAMKIKFVIGPTGYYDVTMLFDRGPHTYDAFFRQLEDLQVRTAVVGCQTHNIAARTQYVLERLVPVQSRPVFRHLPCATRSPDPYYFTGPAGEPRFAYGGTYDTNYTRVLEDLRERQIGVLQALEDLQVRIQTLHCEYGDIALQLAAAVRSAEERYSMTHASADVGAMRATPAPPPPPHHVGRPRPPSTAAAPEAPQVVACAVPGPSPSYRAPGGYKAWDTSTYNASWVINGLLEWHDHQAGALDDLQVKLETLRCEQRNVNAQLDRLISFL
jgi:hypothetical protein